MKYKAVIFDLFGTLVPCLSLQEHRKVMEQMAMAISVPSEDFTRLWMDTSYEREIGIFRNKEANFEHICYRLGVPVDYTQIKLAAQISSDVTKRLMKPRTDALEVISQIRSEGYKTGIISNCASDVPSIWEGTPLVPLIDVAIFSCVVGLAKPAPDIYHLTTEKLAVEPRSCLYIGDGASHELGGASQVGMHAVLIQVPDAEVNNPYRNTAEEWDGPVITSLTGVLALVP